MTAIDFDPDALREKYRIERDKRLRPDGNDQYREVTGALARYVDDPYSPSFEREPLTDDVDFVIVGGGFGGLLAAARLREAGVTDTDAIRMIEKGGDFGGTWYWNRYPGAMCDVESYVYLPLLEELDYIPTEKYAHAPEILAHSQNIARHYDLYDNAALGTAVTGVEWTTGVGDDGGDRWVVRTDRDDAIRAKFLIMSNGPLNRPKLPGIDGVEDFEGHSFHTSRWDYDYTGGDSDGGLVGLAGKRVGIIGTGATAVQCVPHLADGAEHLYVFQRTPSSIDVRNNRPTDEEWAATLEKGWHQERMDNFNTLVSGGFAEEDLVNDGWTDIIGRLLVRLREADQADFSPEGLRRTMELADFEKMEQIRARAQEIVDDPDTAEALKPYYRQFCKRPCFHDEYLDAFNRDNVTLVDTDGKGVERVTRHGVVARGVEYPVDCIVYATGFEVGTSYTRRAGYDIVGRDGVALSDHWADGARTMHGLFVHGFPNLFVMGNQQSAFTVNFPHALDNQARHIAHVVAHVLDAGHRTVETTAEAEAAWVAEIIAQARNAQDFLESCTPGYYNNEGKPGDRDIQNGFYGGGSLAFFAIVDAWKAAGTFDGLRFD